MNNDNQTNFDINPPIATNQYDESIRLFCAAYEPLFVMSNAVLRSIIAGNADLLIVGAGTGMEICTFGQANSGWSMTGVDPSSDMLSIANEKISQFELKNRVNLVQGFTHDLPETDMFDAATCILVMHFLPDDGSKLDILKSISKRLKSGAPLILVDGFGTKDSVNFEQNILSWKSFCETMGVDSQMVEDGFRDQIMKRLQFVSEERISGLLNEAGFDNPTRFFTSFLYGGWVAIKK